MDLRNNLLKLILFISLCNSISAFEWYSNKNKNEILKKNNFFDEKLDDKKLLYTINNHRKYILSNNLLKLYELRSFDYKKIISFNNFKKNVFSFINHEKIVGVYYSFDESHFDKNEAVIKTYYVMRTNKFETCSETNDMWRYSKSDDKWVFIGNSLGWGSPILVNQ